MRYRTYHHRATSPFHSVSFNALNFIILNDNVFLTLPVRVLMLIFGLQTARWLKIEVKKSQNSLLLA